MNYHYNLLILLFSCVVILINAVIGRVVGERVGILSRQNFLGGNYAIGMVLGTSVLSLAVIPFMTLTELDHGKAVLIFFSFLGIASFLAFRSKKQFFSDFEEMKKSLKPDFFHIAFGFFVLVHLMRAALPEVGWDALAYHLSLSKTHKLQMGADFYSAIPKGLDVLFWYGSALADNDTLPKMFHLTYLIAMALFLRSAVAVLTDDRLGRLASLLVLIYHPGFALAHSCFVDIGTSCMEIMSVFSLALWVKNKDLNFFRLAFFSAGAALSLKYTALGPAALVGLIALGFAFFSREHRKVLTLPNFFMTAALFIAPLSFWYLKNLILLGNPVWPFYLGHKGMTEAQFAEIVHGNFETFSFKTNFINFIALPYRIFLGNFQNYSFDGFAAPVGFLFKNIEWGPLVVGIMLFSKKLYRRKDLLVLISIYSLIFILNFFFGSKQIRYVLSDFYLGLLMICFLYHFIKSEKAKKYLSAFAIAFVFYQSGLSHYQVFKYIFPQNTMDKYLSKNLYDYQLVRYKNEKQLPSNETAYTFDILSMRYVEDYAGLRSADQLGLSGKNFDSYAELKSELAGKGIRYWLANKTTTSYRKDDPKQASIIKMEVMIFANGKALDQDGTNFLIEL